MKLAKLGICMLLAAGCGGQDRATEHNPDIDMGPFPIDFGEPFGPRPSFGPTVTAAVPPAPLSGGTLRVLADGKTAVAADPDRDQVYVVDLAAGALRSTIALETGDEPGRAVQDAAGHVHVIARRGGALITIDPVAGTVLARRAVCPAPRGLAYEAGADRLDVACAGGELVTLPAAGGAATRTLHLERDLRDVVVVGSRLWVSTFRTAQVIVVAADGSVGGRIALPGSSDFGLMGPLTPAVAWRMIALGDGHVAVVHQEDATGPVQTTPGGYGGGGPGCGGIVQGAVSLLDGGSATVAGSTALAQVVLPADIAFDAASGNLAVLSAGNAHLPGMPQLFVVPRSVVAGPGAPGTPDMGPVVDGGAPSGGCNFGQAEFVAGEAIALAYDGSSQLWAQTREPAALVRASDGLTITLSSDSRADTGWAIFHTSSGANIACASCHPEGGDDARTWQFAGLGPRRTQSLRGDVGTTAPFHWNGEFAKFDDLLGEVYVGRMSGPKLAADQQQALLGWVDAIPRLPQSPPADPAAVARGQALFDDAAHVGCVTCHSGAQLTNNATVDVGTGALFQVPRLVGVAWRAPFLHDGCAKTLTDRFGSCGGGDLHGTTSQLSAAQIADLVAYLETL